MFLWIFAFHPVSGYHAAVGFNDIRQDHSSLPNAEATRAILVGRNHQLMALAFQIFAQAELARDAAQKRAWLKIDCPR